LTVANSTVAVLLPIPAAKPYSYTVPDGMCLTAGDIVQVPLGPRLVTGIVWGEAGEAVDRNRLKAVERRFDAPPIDANMRRFIDWVADYYLSPPGMVAQMVLRAPAALDPPAPERGLAHAGGFPDRATGARLRVMDLVREGASWTKAGLAHAAGVSASVVDGLVRQGILTHVEIPAPPLVARPDPGHASVGLSQEQDKAAKKLAATVSGGGFSATLIDGVTGSGKTEVYFEAVARCLEQGRQVLILLPEIALTAGFLDRFEARFGAPPAQWHSDVAPKKREQCWRGVAGGEVRAVAGARSALFLPFADLGLIIVDEEHDPAYKQEDRVVYNARDMAVVRAHICGIPVMLASATPSVESRVNAMNGRYAHVRLQQRFASAAMPDIVSVDMRATPPPPGKFISPPLRDAVAEAIGRGEQALLFLNRRGYAPLTLCRACGHRLTCSQCSAWLVEHRFRRILQCHHCGHSEPVPHACPECGAADSLVACGPGVERLAEEVLGYFPEARTVVLSSDLHGGVRRLRMELAAIADGEADIVIGTQLVAKGHNFPLLTCVGVIDADLGLSTGDPRAAERTFQLLSQVTGRAGRQGRSSTGYLQSYQPQHPVIAAIASGDSEAFYEREIENRRRAGLPPFGRLAAIVISGPERQAAESFGKRLRNAAPRDRRIAIFGPAEAPLALIRGQYRFRMLVKAERGADLQGFVRSMIAAAPKAHSAVRLSVDIDPQSFL
jgi:primosomal protein N' (replication factor Y) (superfamily II helicase)